MEQFDAAIIGFGTAGLALGGALADDGQNIVVVEQSDTMARRRLREQRMHPHEGTRGIGTT